MSRKESEDAVSVISFMTSSLRIYWWNPITKVFIIDWQNIINIMECWIKDLDSVIMLSLISFCIIFTPIEVKINIAKERGTVYSLVDADGFLNMLSKFDKFELELQHTDNFIFCVELFVFQFVTQKYKLVTLFTFLK